MQIAATYLKKRHLQLLLTLDKTRHLGQAALALHMSQPAASKALAQMEAEMGHILFQRSGTGMQPTLLGELVIAYAKNQAGAAQRLELELDAVAMQDQRLLKIGILPSASVSIAPRLVSALVAAQPNLEISLHEGLLTGLIDQLLNNELDCVIGRTSTHVDTSHLEELFLYEDPACIVCGSEQALAQQASTLSLEKLFEYRWILPPKDSVLRERIQTMFSRLGLPLPQRYTQSNATLATVTLLNQHPWVGVMPRNLAEYFVQQQALTIFPIDTQVNFGTIQVLTRKETYKTSPLELALTLMQQLFRSR